MNTPLRCLLTAGPTREHIDPIRFLSNGSSGRMGYALAEAAIARGWSVDLVTGPVALNAPEGARVHRVVSAQEMFAAADAIFDECDLFIAVAAVADYRPESTAPGKLKKSGAPLVLPLVPTVDIVRTLAARKRVDQVVVGFAAETAQVEDYARRKLAEKRLDWIVANDVSQPGLGIGADDNAIVLLGAEGARFPFGPAPKIDVASFILDRIASGAAPDS